MRIAWRAPSGGVPVRGGSLRRRLDRRLERQPDRGMARAMRNRRREHFDARPVGLRALPRQPRRQVVARRGQFGQRSARSHAARTVPTMPAPARTPAPAIPTAATRPSASRSTSIVTRLPQIGERFSLVPLRRSQPLGMRNIRRQPQDFRVVERVAQRLPRRRLSLVIMLSASTALCDRTASAALSLSVRTSTFRGDGDRRNRRSWRWSCRAADRCGCSSSSRAARRARRPSCRRPARSAGTRG